MKLYYPNTDRTVEIGDVVTHKTDKTERVVLEFIDNYMVAVQAIDEGYQPCYRVAELTFVRRSEPHDSAPEVGDLVTDEFGQNKGIYRRIDEAQSPILGLVVQVGPNEYVCLQRTLVIAKADSAYARHFRVCVLLETDDALAVGQTFMEKIGLGENAKDSNPKDAVGIGKSYASTVPRPVLWELGNAMLEGSLKYGRHNYRQAGVRMSVYYDATLRHMDSWWEGEDIDPDSNISHVTKAIASLVVLRDAMMHDMAFDDRPPRPANPKWLAELNERAKGLLEKYPADVRKAPFTQEQHGPAGPATKKD